MTEYIDREKVIRAFSDFVWNTCNGLRWNDAVAIVKDMPAEDVKPVLHGEWIEHGECNQRQVYEVWYYECSRCGGVSGIAFDYCPNCGSDMRGNDNG